MCDFMDYIGSIIFGIFSKHFVKKKILNNTNVRSHDSYDSKCVFYRGIDEILTNLW